MLRFTAVWHRTNTIRQRAHLECDCCCFWKCLEILLGAHRTLLSHKSCTPQRAKVKDNPHCLSRLKSSRDSPGGAAQITLLGLQYRKQKCSKTFTFLPQHPRRAQHTHIYIFPPQMMVKAKSPGASLDIPTTNERKSNTAAAAGAVLRRLRRRWFISGDCAAAHRNVRHAANSVFPFFVFAPTAALIVFNALLR
jgi:hypothetical protein